MSTSFDDLRSIALCIASIIAIAAVEFLRLDTYHDPASVVFLIHALTEAVSSG
jgi:hypothetical protein